jgi:hypothetical protein
MAVAGTGDKRSIFARTTRVDLHMPHDDAWLGWQAPGPPRGRLRTLCIFDSGDVTGLQVRETRPCGSKIRNIKLVDPH